MSRLHECRTHLATGALNSGRLQDLIAVEDPGKPAVREGKVRGRQAIELGLRLVWTGRLTRNDVEVVRIGLEERLKRGNFIGAQRANYEPGAFEESRHAVLDVVRSINEQNFPVPSEPPKAPRPLPVRVRYWFHVHLLASKTA